MRLALFGKKTIYELFPSTFNEVTVIFFKREEYRNISKSVS